MSWSEWDNDEQGHPAPLPAHERAWRHPSEMGEQAWLRSEPPLVIGRGLSAATGAIGGLLAMAVLWTMLPTEAGRSAVATVRSTLGLRSETGLVADLTTPVTDLVASTVRTTSVVPSGSTTSNPATSTEPVASSIAAVEPPMPTYQVQQGADLTTSAVAVAVNGGNLVVTTSQAVTAELTVELLLPDGSTDTARVLFVDDRSGLAVLVPDSVFAIESFTVAAEVLPGDQLTFFGDVQRNVTVGADNAIDASWAGDASIREGTPVINQRGELVALCSHSDTSSRLVPLANLDELQQAIAGYTAASKVWMGIALNDDPSGDLSVSAVDPAGPAATAGLTSGDVILTIDDVPVTTGQSLAEALGAHQPGDVVVLGVRRADGTIATLGLTLAQPSSTL